MKKPLVTVIVALGLLGAGYGAGGLVAGRRATEQASYSSLLYLASARNHLTLDDPKGANRVLSVGIDCTLETLRTFREHPQAGVFFITPQPGFLLSESEKAGIEASTRGPNACLIETLKSQPDKAVETTPVDATTPAS